MQYLHCCHIAHSIAFNLGSFVCILKDNVLRQIIFFFTSRHFLTKAYIYILISSCFYFNYHLSIDIYSSFLAACVCNSRGHPISMGASVLVVTSPITSSLLPVANRRSGLTAISVCTKRLTIKFQRLEGRYRIRQLGRWCRTSNRNRKD